MTLKTDEELLKDYRAYLLNLTVYQLADELRSQMELVRAVKDALVDPTKPSGTLALAEGQLKVVEDVLVERIQARFRRAA